MTNAAVVATPKQAEIKEKSSKAEREQWDQCENYEALKATDEKCEKGRTK